MRAFLRILTATTAVGLISACRTGTSVARIDPNQTVDVSGDWNDADAKMVADEMIKQSLSTAWITRWQQAHQGKAPVVRVADVVNRSSEHINTRLFMTSIENAFVNSGAVEIVAGGTDLAQSRAEAKDQQKNASADTRAAEFDETGANFTLSGELNSVADQEGRVAVKKYQVSMKLVNATTKVVAWQGQKEIKKFVQKPLFRP